jgi:hypothetical protein
LGTGAVAARAVWWYNLIEDFQTGSIGRSGQKIGDKMKKLNTIAAAAVLAAVFSGAVKAGNFETDLQSIKSSIPVPAAAEQVSPRSEKLSGLGTLSVKMVTVKAKMERAELTLWNITRILGNKEGGSLNGRQGRSRHPQNSGHSGCFQTSTVRYSGLRG